MNGGGDGQPLNSPLIEYALKGLERCWLPEHGRWSHIYHLDGRKDPNESLPQSDGRDFPEIIRSWKHVGWCLQRGLDRIAVLNGFARQRGGYANPGFDVLLWSICDVGCCGHPDGAVL